MNRTVIIVLCAFLGLGVLSVVIFGGNYMSVANTCVSKEEGLKASKTKSETVYDNFWKKVKEVAQVPAEYNKDMASTYVAIMNGRYENSKNVMMNWIKEANPSFDSSMYKQVQEVIESGRNDFVASQNDMTDRVRDYRTYTETMPNSFFVHLAGYPKIDWKDYDVVTSDRTDNAFKTHKDQAVDVFGKGDTN